MSHTKIACCIALIVVVVTAATLTASADEVVNAVLNSKTTQAFTSQDIEKGDLTTILEAGLSSASAMNQQPWHFVVVSNKEFMEELGGSFAGMPAGMPEGMPEGTKPEGGFNGDSAPQIPGAPAAGTSAKASMGDSPVAIIIYANQSSMSPNVDFDCGLACQNMVIVANALGYGAKIVSSPTDALNGDDHDSICDTLGIDKELYAVGVLLVGRADVEVDGYSGATTRLSIDEKVTFVE